MTAYYRGKYIDHEFLKRYGMAVDSINNRKRKVVEYLLQDRISSDMFNDAMEKLNKELIFVEEIYKIKKSKRKS